MHFAHTTFWLCQTIFPLNPLKKYVRKTVFTVWQNIPHSIFSCKKLKMAKMLQSQIQNHRTFATGEIWVTFSVVLNFLLLGWTQWMGFQNERPMCFHNRQKRHGHSWACYYSNTICKCDGWNRLFHILRPSHFKDCVAIAMCLILALFFPFLTEVCR